MTEITPEMLEAGGKDAGVLKRFIKEILPTFGQCVKFGLFKPEMKNNYYAQALAICHFFGYKTVFEYGAKEIRCHLSCAKDNEPPYHKFVTVIPSIYD